MLTRLQRIDSNQRAMTADRKSLKARGGIRNSDRSTAPDRYVVR